MRVPQSKSQIAQVALLRGINVGRAKRVPMADLRALFTELGYTDVATLLNSGNVVFSGPAMTAPAARRIEEAFTSRFGFSSRMTFITGDEVAEIMENDPIGAAATDHSRYLVAVLNQPGHRDKLLPLAKEKWHPDVLGIGTRVAYMWCPGGFLDSPLQNAVARSLGDAATVRNWATMKKIHALVLKQ